MKFRAIGAAMGLQRRERLAVASLAFVVGALLPLLWWWPQQDDLDRLEAEVNQLRSRLQSAQAGQMRPAPAVVAAPAHAPRAQEQTALWTWLQQGAQAHGLQVQALAAMPMTGGSDLPEQAVRLRLLGSWPDWLALTDALDAQAPWWLPEHWQVVPDGQVPGQVRIELQGRVGFQPQIAAALQDKPFDWPTWQRVRSSSPAGGDIFATPEAAGHAAAARPGASDLRQDSRPLPADPRLWPVRELQLLGLWWQSGEAHAVLGRGLDQVTVSVGQRIGREAYRVRRISAAGVELQAPGVSERGPVLELTWSGEQ